jgi:hypothetical protein
MFSSGHSTTFTARTGSSGVDRRPMPFTCVKGIGCPSTSSVLQFRQSDPAHRRAANGHAIEAFFLFLRADRQH